MHTVAATRGIIALLGRSIRITHSLNKMNSKD